MGDPSLHEVPFFFSIINFFFGVPVQNSGFWRIIKKAIMKVKKAMSHGKKDKKYKLEVTLLFENLKKKKKKKKKNCQKTIRKQKPLSLKQRGILWSMTSNQ